jgi:hypothetical protein
MVVNHCRDLPTIVTGDLPLDVIKVGKVIRTSNWGLSWFIQSSNYTHVRRKIFFVHS